MKTTRKFLQSKHYLNTYFGYVWTVAVDENGKRLGKPMKRMYAKTDPRWRNILMHLDRMRCPLRVKP
jgi:hypothetical protein